MVIMKRLLNYLSKQIFSLDILKKLHYSMPKIVGLIFVLSLLFFYIFSNEIWDNMVLFAWIIAINVLGFVLLYDYLHHKLFYQRYHEERYKKAKRRLEIKERKLKLLLSQAPIGIFYYDKHLRILNYNKIFYKIFGLETNLKGFNLNNLTDKRAVKIMRTVLIDKTSKRHVGSYDFTFKKQVLWAELRCSALVDESGKVIGGVGILEDKTTEHEAYKKINYISHHDSLTGLPNRRHYKSFMQKLINNPKNQEYYSILFYMDLNHFKQINDTFGHLVGDKLLFEVANRFKSLQIENSHLSRLGGDEFTMAVPFVSKDEDSARRRAKEIAKQIKELFYDVFEIEGLNLYMTSSIGIVIIEPKT